MAVTKNGISAYTTSEEVITGNGNGTIKFKAATANTGNRKALQGSFSVQTTAGSPQVSATINATLVAAAEFVDFDQDEATTTSAAGNVTLSGTSNSSKLTFSLGSGDLEVELPTNYTASGKSTVNGAAIEGDPGATAKYVFSVIVPVSENEGVTELTRVVNVESEGGQTDSITIRQTAGAPELLVNGEASTTVSVPQNGSEATVTVTSNTTWTIVQ